jgi:hypothetical protein
MIETAIMITMETGTNQVSARAVCRHRMKLRLSRVGRAWFASMPAFLSRAVRFSSPP